MTVRLASLLALALVACGGHAAAPGPSEPSSTTSERPTSHTPTAPDPEPAEPEEELEVTSTRGSVDPGVVTERLTPRAGAIEACYASRVGRRKWLGGGLELAWDVAADGAIRSVRLSSSDLGAWPIEKCVLDIARSVSFGAPRGGKPAKVTAPVSFSAGSGAVVWDPGSTERAVGERLAKLDACGKGSPPDDVHITLYLGTRGKVQAVGFASARGFSDAWADCAEKTILGWSLTDPRGKVAKLLTTYRPVEASDDELSGDPDDL